MQENEQIVNKIVEGIQERKGKNIFFALKGWLGAAAKNENSGRAVSAVSI